MASGSNLNCTSDHCVLIRKQGPTLVRGLPDPAVLLEDKELKQSFSEVEVTDIFKGDSQAKRAAKFLDRLEVKPSRVFNRFLTVLSSVDKSLARRLTEIYSGAQGKLPNGTA